MVNSTQLLHSILSDSWRYYPEFQKRVKEFCTKYDSDADSDALCRFLRLSFVSDKPTAFMAVGLDGDGVVVGHLLAIVEQWFGKPVCTILQLESEDKIPKEVWDDTMSALRTFGKVHNIEFFQLAARSEAAARLFRRYGFQRTRTIMKMPVEGRAVQTP